MCLLIDYAPHVADGSGQWLRHAARRIQFLHFWEDIGDLRSIRRDTSSQPPLTDIKYQTVEPGLRQGQRFIPSARRIFFTM